MTTQNNLQRKSKSSSNPGPSCPTATSDGQSNSQEVMSAEEIERIISYVEKEYGANISSEIRKVVRDEISCAVPELTSALLPLFASSETDKALSSEDVQQKCVQAFLHVMVPHMQKIVRSVQ